MEQYTNEELNEELEKIRKSYNRAKRLLKNIEEFHDNFQDISHILTDESGGLDATFTKVKDIKLSIAGYEESSSELLQKIKDNLSKTNLRITEMEDAYTKFSVMKGNIEGRSNEIENLLSQSSGLKDDIVRIKSDAQGELDNIEQIYSDFQTKIEDMNKAYDRFITINEQIEDEDNGLDAILASVKATKAKIVSISKEIQDFKVQSLTILGEISKNKDKSDELKDAISDNLDISNTKKNEIEEVTNLILDTGFANAFQARAKKLFIGYIVWGIIFGLAVTVFIIFLVILFYSPGDTVTIPSPGVILYRLSLTSPLLILIGFSIKQYSKERDLNEKYEFKATIATVVRNHITFLISTFGNDNDRIIEFTSATFNTLYKEPYSDDKFSLKMKSLKKEVLELKAKEKKLRPDDLDNIINSMKELTEIIPDEGTLKKIITFFVSR